MYIYFIGSAFEEPMTPSYADVTRVRGQHYSITLFDMHSTHIPWTVRVCGLLSFSNLHSYPVSMLWTTGHGIPRDLAVRVLRACIRLHVPGVPCVCDDVGRKGQHHRHTVGPDTMLCGYTWKMSCSDHGSSIRSMGSFKYT